MNEVLFFYSFPYLVLIVLWFDFSCLCSSEHATQVTSSLKTMLGDCVGMLSYRRPAHIEALRNDPLISFALAFSALIHDVDHSGM